VKLALEMLLVTWFTYRGNRYVNCIFWRYFVCTSEEGPHGLMSWPQTVMNMVAGIMLLFFNADRVRTESIIYSSFWNLTIFGLRGAKLANLKSPARLRHSIPATKIILI
jgi:hypothetical protein